MIFLDIFYILLKFNDLNTKTSSQRLFHDDVFVLFCFWSGNLLRVSHIVCAARYDIRLRSSVHAAISPASLISAHGVF